MNNLEIRVNATEAVGLLGRISDNFPRARTWALNRTAEEVNAQLQRDARAAMIFRGAPGARVLRLYAPTRLPGILRARDDKPSATPVDPYSGGKILRPFETGAWKTGNRFGSTPAIPTKYARPTPQSSIPKKLFPSSLFPELGTNYSIGKDATKWSRGKGRKGKSFKSVKPFILNPSTMKGLGPKAWGIYIRTEAQGRGNIRMLWAFRPAVRRPKTLHTYATARRVASERWSINMVGMFRSLVRSGRGNASFFDLGVR